MLVRLVRTSLAGLVVALASTLLVAIPSAPSASAAVHHRHATRWDCLAHYESGHDWSINTGNGYYGGLQFSLGTWRYYGGFRYSGHLYPNKASRRDQIHIARRVAFDGWRGRAPQGGGSAWPSTWRLCF